MNKSNKQPAPVKVGRDAGSGKFIPVAEARRRPGTAIVETIKPSSPKRK